jgi:putative transposase
MGPKLSPDLISRVTDAVLDEVREWQNRPLDPVYPVVFFDALRVKIRDEGLVKNKAVYVALALNPDGEKDVLGLWIDRPRVRSSGSRWSTSASGAFCAAAIV